MAVKKLSAEELDKEVELALEFGMITFGMGLGASIPEISVDAGAVPILKARYRQGMQEFLLKHGLDRAKMQAYLTKRGKQIGTKAARMATEFASPGLKGKNKLVLTVKIAEEAAIAVEAEVKGPLKKRYERIYGKHLDVICP